MALKINKNLTIIYCAILLSMFGRVADIFELGALKNIRFVAPILLLVYTLSKVKKDYNHKKLISPYFNRLFIFYIIIGIYTFITAIFFFDTGYTYRNIVNIVLILSPLIIANSISKLASVEATEKIIDFIFYCFISIYCLEMFKNGVSLAGILSVFKANLITDSVFETESGVSLVLGFFALYYLNIKKYKYFVLSCFLTLIAAKRIAIFGLMITGCIYFVYPLIEDIFRKRRILVSFLIASFGIILAYGWHLLITGEFNETVEELTGLSINRFFMGRMGRFDIFFSFMTEKNFPGLGYGVGYVENILYYKAHYETAFHNDYYRLFIEFGAIAFFFWLWFNIYYNLANKLALSAFVLLLILMQTDNVFMYDRVMISYFILYIYSLKNTEAFTQSPNEVPEYDEQDSIYS